MVSAIAIGVENRRSGVQMLAKLGHELWMGDAAAIRAGRCGKPIPPNADQVCYPRHAEKI